MAQIKVIQVADGVRYVATAKGKTYRSLDYHRSAGGRRKGIWDISRPDEFGVFCVADDNDWYDRRGYWSFRFSTKEVLGTQGERMAFFPHKAPSADDWHGFPLHLTPVRRPEARLATVWYESKQIGFAVAEKIKRGRL